MQYVHRVCWAAEGALFASASFDASLRVFEWPADPDLRASPLPEAWNAVFPSTVEDIQLLKVRAEGPRWPAILLALCAQTSS